MLNNYVYEQPGHLIRRAHQLAWAVFKEETSQYDLTPVQYSLLVAAQDFPAIDATRLSELICIDRATIGDIVSRLELKKCLVRKADPVDKRSKRIFVTPEGRALIESVNKVRGKIANRVLARLNPTEKSDLIKLLAKLVYIEEVKRLAAASSAAVEFSASRDGQKRAKPDVKRVQRGRQRS